MVARAPPRTGGGAVVRPDIVEAAFQLRIAIEHQHPPETIEQQAQELIGRLGGNKHLHATSPGATALYIASLILTQPE